MTNNNFLFICARIISVLNNRIKLVFLSQFRSLTQRGNIYALSKFGIYMDDSVMSIENNPQMRQFIQLWMMSGSMVLATIKEILEDGRQIEMPEMMGRDFKAEIVELSMSFSEIVSRFK